MRLRANEQAVIEDRELHVTAIVGATPAGLIVLAVEAPTVAGVRASFALGPFARAADAYDALIDGFVDRFARYPDGPLGASARRAQGELLGKVVVTVTPQPLDRDMGFLCLMTAWRAADVGRDVTEAVATLWRSLKGGGEGFVTALSIGKEEKQRARVRSVSVETKPVVGKAAPAGGRGRLEQVVGAIR